MKNIKLKIQLPVVVVYVYLALSAVSTIVSIIKMFK